MKSTNLPPDLHSRFVFRRLLGRQGTALIALTIAMVGSSAAQAQIFTNPSFESGFTGWTTSQGNGAATFSAVTASPSAYVGSASAKIVVTNPGTTYPSLSQTFTADPSQTYLLRFFSQSVVNRPLMYIQVTSASGPVYSAAKFDPSSSGWEEYHWPFRASGLTTVTIKFAQATTYNLDQVQVYDGGSKSVDHTGTIMDPETAYMYHWGQTPGTKGLMNTDSNISIPLPDGRVAWLFNDTNYGVIDPYNNSAGHTSWGRNCFLIQNGESLSRWSTNVTPFTPATAGSITWPTDGFVEGNTLKLLLPDIGTDTTYGMNVATLSLPDLTLLSYPSTYLPWSVVKVIDGGDGYWYLYNQTKIGRVTVGSFSNTAAWRYWDGSTWNSSSAAAIDLPNYTAASSLERLGPNNFAEVYAAPLGSTFRVRFSRAPQGPWDSTDYTIGTPAWEAATSFYYMPRLHRETYQNGVYSVGYSDIGSEGADTDRGAVDQCYYNTQFFRTPNLLALSPYTTNSFVDTFSQNDVAGWQTYGGTWTAANGKYSVTAGGGNMAVLKGILPGNITLEADVTPAAGGDAGLIFRASDYAVGTNNYNGYYVGLVPGTGVELGKSDGSFHQLALANMTITAGATYPVRVVASGSSIQVFVGKLSTPAISVTDTTYASGGVGIRAHNCATTWDNFNVNIGYSYAGQQAETEALTATFTTGVTHRVFTWTSFSGGAGTILDATAAGQQVTYTLPAVGAGTYDVRVGVKKAGTRGTFQLAIASSGTQVFGNVGAVQDEFATADQFAEFDLGNWTPTTSTDKLVRFTVAGKNSASAGYSITFDYIKLIPQ